MSKGEQKKGFKKTKDASEGEFSSKEYKLVAVDYLNESDQENEIDLIDLIKKVWYKRKTVYKFVIIGGILGVLVALLSPKEYVASATLMPEYSSESQGGASSILQQFGGAFGLSGGSYNANSNAIRVDLYPQIVSSLTFQYKLAVQEFFYPEYDTTTSLYYYFKDVKDEETGDIIKQYTIGLPSKLLSVFFSSNEKSVNWVNIENDEVIDLTKEQVNFIQELRGRTRASLDDKSGIISVSARMPDPQLAAEVTRFTIDELTKYLTEYRTEKLLRDLEFIEEQLAKAEERYNKAQLELANFRDSNQGVLTSKAQTEEQRLQSEFSVAGNVYSSFTQQYEESKIKVQEETPMFKVLQPVQVPVNDEKSGAAILFVFLVLSTICSIGWIFFQERFFNQDSKI